jgi:3-oxoacyl-[acyl-carrier-protein] synthase-3
MTRFQDIFRSVLIGAGGYLPERVVTNHDMLQFVDTSHEWIVERTGIHQRYFAGEDQVTSDLGAEAAKIALKNAGLSAQDIDLIVVGTATPDKTFPSTATRIQEKIGNTQGFAFDVAAVCAGFLVALSVADKYIQSGQVKNALVIGAETPSRIVNMEDRRTCILFGDGAGAWVLQGQKSEGASTDTGVLDALVYSDGRFCNILHTDGGPSSTGQVGQIQMEGKEVFRHAVEKLSEAAEIILKKNNITSEQIDWFIPHQANSRIIEAVAKRLNFPSEKIIQTVDRHANTSAASIPLAFYEAQTQGLIKPGQLILHEAIGGGLVWGSALVRV